jgi:hypothetical protein
MIPMLSNHAGKREMKGGGEREEGEKNEEEEGTGRWDERGREQFIGALHTPRISP